MDALSIASAGLTAATARYTVSASAIASGAGDLAANLTELSLAKVAVEASAAVVRTSADLSKQLVEYPGVAPDADPMAHRHRR